MSSYVLTAEAQRDLKQIRDYVLDEGGGLRAARYVGGAFVAGFAPSPERLDRDTGETNSRSGRNFASGLFSHI